MSQFPNVPSTSDVAGSFSMNGPVVEMDPVQRKNGMIAHVAGIFGILGTGILYLMKKDDATFGPFAMKQLKDAFNFHVIIAVAWVALVILAVIIGFISYKLLLIVWLLYMVVGLAVLALVIINALKANKGISGSYPISFPVLK